MILPENEFHKAAVLLTGSKSKADGLIQSLIERPEGSFQFFGKKKRIGDGVLLILNNQGATATFLASPPTSGKVDFTKSLIQEGLRALNDAKTTTLAQTLIGNQDVLLSRAFTNAGFTKLAILTFMEQNRVPNQKTKHEGISIRRIARKDDELLGQLLNETYIDSLDCPKIHGAREVQQIIDGHRGGTDENSQVWAIAELENKPAGVILLNSHHKFNTIELCYIGVAPFARGCGVGNALMQYAADKTKKLDCQRVTLAVDSKNIPAIQLYKKWNFFEKNKRVTFIHKLSTSC
jgi:ribosomal protein S18 acetylase RimI-like enzyme